MKQYEVIEYYPCSPTTVVGGPFTRKELAADMAAEMRGDAARRYPRGDRPSYVVKPIENEESKCTRKRPTKTRTASPLKR